MGGKESMRRVLEWLASSRNEEFTKWPPNPQEFLILSKKIPVTNRNFSIPKINTPKITLTSRVYSGITKLCAGSRIEKSHADIIELVKYNFEKYQEHRKIFGDPIPGSKDYNYYKVDLKGAQQ